MGEETSSEKKDQIFSLSLIVTRDFRSFRANAACASGRNLPVLPGERCLCFRANIARASGRILPALSRDHCLRRPLIFEERPFLSGSWRRGVDDRQGALRCGFCAATARSMAAFKSFNYLQILDEPT
jgi:hypothetical protein